MKDFKILVLIGSDRPGIVDQVATYLHERGANIEDSRMAAMGGRFTMMTLCSAQPDDMERIGGELDELREMGFDVRLHDAEDPDRVQRRAGLPLNFSVTAMDHAGIVRQVVGVLHRRGVNITSLDTHVEGAPLSGAPLFGLSVESMVPEDASIAGIKQELSDLAARMNMDVNYVK